MFSGDEAAKITESYSRRLSDLRNHRLRILEEPVGFSSEEELCLKYLYAHMPCSDIASYNEEVFADYVRNAIKVRKLLPWGNSIPTDIFLNYVLQYRVNNENIEPCRSELFTDIYPSIKDLNMQDAAIEVNYWCLGKATYRLTDNRTASPMTIIRRAFGRCGEESLLTVNALRSVGIPARQCYVPRWSHCDDNHAWVEVWVDGNWHFMGACEPEPVLNKSWFTSAASKAMLVYSRVFSTEVGAEEIVKQKGGLTSVNCLKTYAETTALTVQVKDGNGFPVEGASVRFELLNYSELFPIAELYTGAEGEVDILTGLGDLFLHVHKEGLFITEKVDVRKTNHIEINMGKAVSFQESSFDFEMAPPAENIYLDNPLSETMSSRHQDRLKTCDEKRKACEDTFFSVEKDADYLEQFGSSKNLVSELLVKTCGNYAEMQKFLTDVDNQELLFKLQHKLMLLETLTEKDYGDMRADVLNEHMAYALEYKGKYSDEIFSKYILSPRIGLEYIECYREKICQKFDTSAKAEFRANPQSVFDFISKSIIVHKEELPLLTTPAALLDFGAGSAESCKLLFVAICRTLGVPARLNPVNSEPEYLKGGNWKGDSNKKCGSDGSGRLVLKKKPGTELLYTQQFSVAILENGVYRTLDCMGLKWQDDKLELQASAGHYRILTSSRQIDGSLLARAYHVIVESDENTEIYIEVRENQIKERLRNSSVSDFSLKGENGAVTSLKELVESHSASVVAVLEVGKEPTEHLLNEILDMKEQFVSEGLPIIMLVKDPEDFNYDKLRHILSGIPLAQSFIPQSSEHSVEALFRESLIGDHRLPLAVVIDGNMHAKFGFANYNVGTADLLLQIVKA